MRFTVDIDTNDIGWIKDVKALINTLKTWVDLYEKGTPAKDDKTSPDTVRTIIKEPTSAEPKKNWNEKQKSDIQAIKEAHKAMRDKMKASADPPQKKGRTRSDIDNSLIVYMIDEQKRKPKDIAKELGCCLQTVMNRYHRGKREAGGK